MRRNNTSNSSSTTNTDSNVTCSKSHSHYRSPRIAAMISKAARHGLKRLHTGHEQRRRHSNQEQTPLDSPLSDISDMYSTDNYKPLYLMTMGQEEADRIQLKNDLVKLAFDGEFSLPIDFNKIKGGSVLDIGCGPGDWCLNLAEEFPDLQQVIGVDIVNDMFPDPSYSVPSNCQFMTLNVLNGLHGSFPLESFDCIHFRFMSLAFTYDQYLTAVQNCWDLLKPGGYIVLMEMDTKVSSPGPTTEKLNQHVMDAAQNRGLSPRLAQELGTLIPKGAVNRYEKYRSLPIGLWGGRLGVLFREDLFHGLIHTQVAINEFNASQGKPVLEQHSTGYGKT
ncbi:hypothetical protein LRAMOSA00344 [Lichtheimia ramosa]|uniref:Methyltransferase domain-containing protein n=1 Tax=Lichtheimia ramosa TaxID=688394 RepID=A0A077W685_9FUNG|nr:hypothetical protein LRAMOSA00344 [Lichtheimia ramosa]